MTDTAPRTDSWTVAGRTFNSRLIVGTGKYRDYAQNAAAAEASGAEMVTVAVRRVNLTDPSQPVLTDFLDPKKYTYLPNTAGCFTGEDAVRTLRLAREAGGWTLVKLEVLADQRTLFPDMEETLRSLKLLTAEGFEVMVYCTDDPVYARKLEDAGAVAIMPLGCDGVLMNTAIAEARDPILMASAMKHAVIAGRESYLAGRMKKRLYADPSSPLAGLI